MKAYNIELQRTIANYLNLLVSVTLIIMALNPIEMANAQENSVSNVDQVAQGNRDFNKDLYGILKDSNSSGGNVFYSPFSIHTILSMVYQGAKMDTAKALGTALKLAKQEETDVEKLQQIAANGYENILNDLNNQSTNVKLLVANKIYLKKGDELQEKFQEIVTKKFASELESLNFGNSVESSSIINNWVSNKTNNKIKDLIKSGDLNDLTKLVLVNAIYFKGDWLHKFNKDLTMTEAFYLNDKDTVMVPMMRIEKNLPFHESTELNAKILELPYKDPRFSMIILLPNEKQGINELEKKLSTIDLNDIVDNLRNTGVNVVLPKFKIEQEINLNDVLKKMGLDIIFDQKRANFKGMIKSDDDLYVSKAVHKAFVEVNEDGAEAAAATGIVAVLTAAPSPSPKPSFKADHPFIFMIMAKSSSHSINRNAVLFPLFIGNLKSIN